MKHYDYFLLLASVFIAPHISKNVARIMSSIYLMAFLLFIFLEAIHENSN